MDFIYIISFTLCFGNTIIGVQNKRFTPSRKKGMVMKMGEIMEVFMLICFGLSWPVSVYKSYKAHTAVGKSPVFLTVIWLGYIFGISGKILAGNVNYVLIIYIFNLVIVSLDVLLYFRNKAWDAHKSIADA